MYIFGNGILKDTYKSAYFDEKFKDFIKETVFNRLIHSLYYNKVDVKYLEVYECKHEPTIDCFYQEKKEIKFFSLNGYYNDIAVKFSDINARVTTEEKLHKRINIKAKYGFDY